MIYWLIFVILEIVRNYVLIEVLELRPHYGWSAAIRLFAGAVCLLIAQPAFDPLGDLTTIFPAVTFALFQWTSFYVSFDIILNKLRGKAWDYKGDNSGTLDKLPKTKYYLLKIASLVVLVLSLIAIL